jgi:polysaccharide export outer membrane protein
MLNIYIKINSLRGTHAAPHLAVLALHEVTETMATSKPNWGGRPKPGFRTILLTLCATAIFAAPSWAQAPAPAGSAAQAVTVPANYVIGPEDVLGIVFWRETEMSGDVTVRPDGRITLPLIGEIQAEGQRPQALRDQIQLAAGKYMTDANVSVVVRQIHSRKVFITGNVTNPGGFPLVGPRNVMQVIALAGGLTEYADSKNITIVRDENGRSRSFKFNYKDVAKGKKLEQNIQLQPGDTVVVP